MNVGPRPLHVTTIYRYARGAAIDEPFVRVRDVALPEGVPGAAHASDLVDRPLYQLLLVRWPTDHVWLAVPGVSAERGGCLRRYGCGHPR